MFHIDVKIDKRYLFSSIEDSTRSAPASPAPPPPVLGFLSFGLGVVGGLGDAVGGAVTAVGGALETVSRYCTVLYCTVLYCTVLYCTVLYCTDRVHPRHREEGAGAAASTTAATAATPAQPLPGGGLQAESDKVTMLSS